MKPSSIDKRKVLFALDEVRQIENRLRNLELNLLDLLPTAKTKKSKPVKLIINGKPRVL